MKRALTAVACVLIALASAHAQNNNCVYDATTNCTTGSGKPFSISVTQPATGWPYAGWPFAFVGEEISVTAIPSNGIPGLLDIIAINEDCLISETVIFPTNSNASNWWVATGEPFSGSGSGTNVVFTPTSCGTGTIVFYMSYDETSPCGTGSNVVAMTNAYTAVSVLSLGPTNNTNCMFISSNATLQTYAISVSTNPSVTNLKIVAVACPDLTNFPDGWSLNGERTNITFVPITSPGVYTVVCLAGTSGITNIIWVLAPDGDVEHGCTTNGPDILGYWSFNNSLMDWWQAESNANDSVGSNNGTLANITFTNGYLGDAFYFNGVNAFISFGTNAGNFGTNDFTIDFWMATTEQRQRAVLSKNICDDNSWLVFVSQGGNINFEFEQDSLPHYITLTSHSQVNDGLFHEVTISRSAQTLIIYVDGNFDASLTMVGITDLRDDDDLVAGVDHCGATGYFYGMLDEIKLGSGLSSPWTGNLGQPPIAAFGLQNPASPWGDALQIDTTNSANLRYRYMEDDGSVNLNCINGAVSFWFKPDWNGGTGPGSPGRLLEMGDTNSPGGWWSLWFDGAGSSLYFQTQSNGVCITYFTNSISSWSSNNWYQLVLDYSTNGVSLFVNGAQTESGPGITNYPAITNRMAYGFSVGSDHNGTNQVHGIIDELYTFDCPLTAPEVATGFSGYGGYPGTNENAAPSIITQPSSQTIVVGSNATFSVTALGVTPLTYQWSFNGTNIVGATDSTFGLSTVGCGQIGYYAVTVSNQFGWIASSNAELTVFTTLTAPSTETGIENYPLVISGISISDASTGTNEVQLAFWATNGVLGFAATNGLTFLQGTNGATTNLTISGTLSNLNAVLDMFEYIPNTNSYGNDSLNIEVVCPGGGGLTNTARVSLLIIGGPPGVSNLIVWFAADSGVQTNGSGITNWADKSNHGNSVRQTSSGAEPILVTNALNGWPAVQFNPTNSQFLFWTNNFFAGTTGAEAFVVLRAAVENTGGNNRPLWDLGGDSQQLGYPDQHSNIVENFGTSATKTLMLPAQPLTQYHVYEVAGQSNFWAAWINGILQSSTTNNTYATNPNPRLGIVENGNGYTYFNGDVAEVIIFSRTLSLSERLGMNDYLNVKYGLVTNVPATPSNLVATAISSNQISLTWNFNLGTSEIGFDIGRATNSNGPYILVGTVANTLSYVDTNLAAGTTYYYEVAAVNVVGASDSSSPAWATTLSSQASLPFGNLLLWLKADAGLTQGGTNDQVFFWADQSGHGNNASQTGSGTEPLLVTNAFNGWPVVRFNPTNGQYLSFPNFFAGTTSAEAFVVLKAAVENTGGNNRPLWDFGGDSVQLGYPDQHTNIVEDFGSTAYKTLVLPAQPLTQYHVYEVAGQSNFWGAWINGILQSSTNNNTYATNGTPRLGTVQNGDGDNYFNGDVAEVLIFNRTLNTAERLSVNNYLELKYSLITNVPATPSNLVATAISSNQISLTWSFNLGPTQTEFSIGRATSSNGSYSVVATAVNTLSYVDANLAAGTTYYYEVAAVDAVGQSGNSSPAWATTLASGAGLPFGNLLVWLKADAGLTEGGQNNQVFTWPDQSGNGNNAGQSASSSPPAQPILVTNVLNGWPVVRFNPTNSQYLNLPNFLAGTTAAEGFVVLKAVSENPGAPRSLWSIGGNSSGQNLAYPNSSGNIVDEFGSASLRTMGSPAQPLTQYHIYEVAGQSNFWGAWINGILQSTTTNNSYVSNGAPTLGGSFNPNANNFFSGDMAEVLIFNRTLSASERLSVNNYLNAKYDLVTNSATPTNLAATAISSNQISLTWSYNLGSSETIFDIERSTMSNGTYSVVATAGNTLSYVDTNLTEGATYYYEVAAINAMGESSNSSSAWATTTNGGTSLPFESLALWLKADAGLAQTGTNTQVNFWPDQSGNGNNANQTASNNQPRVVTSVLNGFPALHFSANSNTDFNLSAFLSSSLPAEAFVVLRAVTNSPGTNRYLWEFGSTSTGTTYPLTSGQIADDFGSASDWSIGFPIIPITQFHLYDADSDIGDWVCRINGFKEFATNESLPDFTHAVIGGSSNGCFDGDIAEILMFNKALTSGERDTVGFYLNGKYNFMTNQPPVPGGLLATGVSPYQMNLTWTNATVSNGLTFTVERKIGASGVYAEIGNTWDVDSYLDSSVMPGSNYFYRVSSWNLSGSSSNSSEISPPSIVITNPPPESLFSTTNLTTNVTINAVANDLDGSVTQVDFWINADLASTTTNTPYNSSLTNLGPGVYNVMAEAIDNQGNSSFSDVVPVIIATNLCIPVSPPATNTAPVITLTEPFNAVLIP